MEGRIEAFVTRMHIGPTDRVLEIGCGHGIAASLVCARLTTGKYVAIDRSSKMIAAAKRRNSAAVASGKAELIVGDLEAVDLGSRKFDKIFAMRVGLFHREPERARDIAAKWLAPRGELFVEYDQP